MMICLDKKNVIKEKFGIKIENFHTGDDEYRPHIEIKVDNKVVGFAFDEVGREWWVYAEEVENIMKEICPLMTIAFKEEGLKECIGEKCME